ncbi:two-component system sensor histidine kinase AtoS [Desulfothermobacter acidiphilus]|uniref:two-component system sensor histidine kinase AtoS n=1 Tax=Desulfothermobacter acidiphilus TaxID=1938353 RepID=UPI003F8C9862
MRVWNRRLGFSKQLFLFTFVLLALPSLLTFYMLYVMQRAEQGMLEGDKAKLEQGMALLDRRFPGTFNDLLRANNVPPDARTRDKVRVLNEALKPVIDSVAAEYPGVEFGFYSKELDVILNGHTETYGENFSIRRKEDIERAVTSSRPVTTVLGLGGTGLIEAYRPLVRNGEVIGAVVAQENTKDVYQRLVRVRREAYLTIIAGIIIGVGGFFFLLNRFLEIVSRVKEGLSHLETDLTYRLPPAFGELGEIATAINHLANRLAEVKSFNELVLDNVEAGVVALDTGGKVVLVNPVAARILELDPKTIVGRPVTEVFPPGPLQDVLQQAWEQGKTVRDLSLRYPGSKGERELIAGTNFLTGPQGKPVGVLLTFRDITERRRLEERVQRQERLAALGKFVAGVAHEIRNPLTTISGYIQMWQRYGRPTPHSLPLVAQEVQRLNNIVDKLLFFARPAEMKLKPQDLNQLVNQVLQFIGQAQDSKVKVDVSLGSELPPVWLDPEQMRQVLMNIIYNSYQAMPEGGQLQVRTGLAPDGTHVVVQVSDTGCGIPEENLPRIFDPFFTTKARGSGLGLALAHEIVTAHGGHIEVESQVGVGTTVRVYLPVTRREVK